MTLELELPDRVRRYRGAATIGAVETSEGTVYVLECDGLPAVTAWWPQPLLELCPHAERVATSWGSYAPARSGLVVNVGAVRGSHG